MTITTKAQVHSVHPLTDSIIQLTLSPDDFKSYLAGQYCQLMHGGQAYPFSIANAALGSHKLELHIRHSKDNPYNESLLNEIRSSGSIELEYPLGNCHIGCLAPNKPIIFIAGGTGFSPVKAMVEQLLADSDGRPMHLFWGAKSVGDLYSEDLVKQWHHHVAHFRYTPVLSGSRQLIATVLNAGLDLANSQFVAAGAFDMVYRVRDALVEQGVSREVIFSDAFDFESP